MTFLSLALMVGCASSDKITNEERQSAVAETQAPELALQLVAAKGKKAKTAKESKSAAPAAKSLKSEPQIRGELDEVARKLTGRVARTVRPSKTTKEVKKVGKEHVATYVEVDVVNVTSEMRPASTPGNYVGIIRYSEKLFECRGTNQKSALDAICQQAGKSNHTEMIMFDGKTLHY
ncbi:MAG: translation initiation factor 2 [Desulfovibrio sp.]|nr:translation initiation factor 2 [Desulfovibrio sp.]